jgi:hypothetical protein
MLFKTTHAYAHHELDIPCDVYEADDYPASTPVWSGFCLSVANRKSQIANPKSQIPNPKSQIPKAPSLPVGFLPVAPKSQIANHKSQIEPY